MVDPGLAFAISLGLAAILDALIGDPVFRLHPVRLIGDFALFMEKFTRRRLGPRRAGLLTWLAVFGLTLAVGIDLSYLAWRWSPLAGLCCDAVLLWASIAPRDLAGHAWRIWCPLSQGDLPTARAALAMIVGRQTAALDESGVVRATVEGVAESTIDGILAPLFWAALFGPAAALAYRAVNTMDSLFGHRNPRYEQFGWWSARSDDLANFLPARCGIFPILLASRVLGLDSAGCWRIFRRDRLKHLSPNAAHPEAAFAGALGIRLGGPSRYPEGLIDKPFLGDPHNTPGAGHIRQAVWLMLIASLGGLVATGVLRYGFLLMIKI